MSPIINPSTSPTKTQTIKATRIVNGNFVCLCDKPAERLQSQSVTNPGRWYYICAQATNPCNTWKWEDTIGELQTSIQGSVQTPSKGINPPSTPTTVRTKAASTPEASARRLKTIRDAQAVIEDNDAPAISSRPTSPLKPKAPDLRRDRPAPTNTLPPAKHFPLESSPFAMDVDMDVDSNPFNEDSFQRSYMSSNSLSSGGAPSPVSGTKSSVIVDSLGSPKRPRPRPGKERADDRGQARSRANSDSITSFQSHQNEPISPVKAANFTSPTKSSAAEIEGLLLSDRPSPTKESPPSPNYSLATEAIIQVIHDIPRHMRLLEEGRRTSDQTVKDQVTRIRELDDQLAKAQREIEALKQENKILKGKLNHLEATVEHYKAGGGSI